MQRLCSVLCALTMCLLIGVPAWAGSYTPDSGIRIEKASNPGVCVHDDTVYLIYQDRSVEPNKIMMASSEDGITFGSPFDPDVQKPPCHPRATLLPDGTWRKYMFDMMQLQMVSESSDDGVNFTPDDGVRYTPADNDNNTVGVYEVYTDAQDTVRLVYIGDMQGLNNIRMAVSSDEGMSFTQTDDDVLGDKAYGGSHSFVDPKVIHKHDGSYQMITMVQGGAPLPGQRSVGVIYSFDSPDGITFSTTPTLCVTTDDYTEHYAWSLNDPVVAYHKGTYRMYIASLISDEADGSDSRWVMVSAQFTGNPSYTYVAPYVRYDAQHWSGAAISNVENKGDTSIRFQYFGFDGKLLKDTTETVKRFGQSSFLVEQQDEADEGWLLATASQPIHGVMLIGDNTGPMYDVDFTSELTNELTIAHMDTTDQWQSTLIVANPNEQGLNIQFAYYSTDGTEKITAPKQPAVARMSMHKFDLAAFFPGKSGGSVILKSDRPMTAFLLYDGSKAGTSWLGGLSVK